MNRTLANSAATVFAIAIAGFQLSCSYGQGATEPEALNDDFAYKSQAASTMCARVGVRLVVVSRKEQPDRSMHYEFAEVADAECTEEKVWKVKR